MSAEPREPTTVENRVNTGVDPARLQEVGAGDVGRVPYDSNTPWTPGTASVDHALGDALVIEVHDLLAEVEVLEQGRSAVAGLQRVVGVGESLALSGGEEVAVLCGHLARPWRQDGLTRRVVHESAPRSLLTSGGLLRVGACSAGCHYRHLYGHCHAGCVSERMMPRCEAGQTVARSAVALAERRLALVCAAMRTQSHDDCQRGHRADDRPHQEHP